MNAPERLPLPDIQALPDIRRLAIQRVGIRSVRHPVEVRGAGGEVSATVATFDMYVGLPPEQKGTHMSRFIEILQAHRAPLSREGVAEMFCAMLARLEATSGHLELRFPHFISKIAPVSGVRSLMDYDVTMRVERRAPGASTEQWLEVLVPVTSLCPCSKEISAYGAHNQRSHVIIRVLAAADFEIADAIALAERAASCELFGLLKRTDEKFVTERAYENPKFVEDLVRDIAFELREDARVEAFTVSSENFESIHNHSAYARIELDKRAAA